MVLQRTFMLPWSSFLPSGTLSPPAARNRRWYPAEPRSHNRDQLVQILAYDRSLGGGGLVQPADRRGVRRVASDLRILGALAQDVGDRVGEGVERLARLGLGRLDQQRLVDEQREVDRRR